MALGKHLVQARSFCECPLVPTGKVDNYYDYDYD